MFSPAKIVMDQLLTRWNRVITPSMRFVGETETHFLFIHATKGHRKVSKKRVLPNLRAA